MTKGWRNQLFYGDNPPLTDVVTGVRERDTARVAGGRGRRQA